MRNRWVAGSRYYEGRVKDQQPPPAAMTGDEFRSRYKLLKVVDEQGVQSHHALSPTGRVVMVHFLAGAQQQEQRRLCALLDRLRPADRTRILDTLDVDGATVLVTEFIQGFKTLAAWLDSKAKLPPTEAAIAPPAASSPAPAPAPGEFTSMFGADEVASLELQKAAAPSPEEQGPPPASAPTPVANTPVIPGGFTAFFGAIDAEQAAPAPAPAPPPPDSETQGDEVPPPKAADDASRRPVVRWRDEPPKKPEEGRAKPVVRWNAESPVPPVAPRTSPPPAVTPPAPPKKPGEFTQLFGAVGTTPPVTPAAPPAAASASGAPGSARPGEFTSLFNPVVEPAVTPLRAAEPSSEQLLRALDAPPAPTGGVAPNVAAPSPIPLATPNQAAAPGEFTRMLSGIPTPAAAQGASAGAAEGVGARGGGGGGSEYTRLVARAQPSPAAPAAKRETPASPGGGEAPGRPMLPLILGGAAVLLLIVVAAYFVLR